MARIYFSHLEKNTRIIIHKNCVSILKKLFRDNYLAINGGKNARKRNLKRYATISFRGRTMSQRKG